MNDISKITVEAVREAVQQVAPSEQISPVIRKLFILFHGAYGNLLAAKYSTGEKDSQGKDKGIRVAMRVWESKLQAYPDDVIETAAGRLAHAHPEFPPSLPQFELLCQAAAPRQTYAQENNLPRLAAPPPSPAVEVSFAMCNDGKDWARRILARAEAGDRINPYTLRSAQMAVGLVETTA